MFNQPHTANEALATLLQEYQVNPVAKPVLRRSECLPLTMPIVTRVGREIVVAVVSGYNPNDMQRVRVSWFDTVDRVVRHKFVDQERLAKLERKNQTAAVA